MAIHSNKYLEVGRFRVDRRRSTKSRISSIYSGATGFCCKRIRESVHFCRWKSLPRIEFILLCILSIILESHSPLLRVVLTLKARCRLFSLYISRPLIDIYVCTLYLYAWDTRSIGNHIYRPLRSLLSATLLRMIVFNEISLKSRWRCILYKRNENKCINIFVKKVNYQLFISKRKKTQCIKSN